MVQNTINQLEGRTGVGLLHFFVDSVDNHSSIKEHTLQMPTLFIAASGDAALPPSLSEGMDEHIPKLARRQVDTTHWALIEAPKQVNDYIWQWLEPLLKQEEKSVL